MKRASNRSRQSSVGKSNRASSRQKCRQFESLETRALLTVTFNSGQLDVTGTSAADLIQFDRTDNNRLQVRLNSQVVSSNIPLASITQINVKGEAGADKIVVSNIAKPFSVDGGTEDDSLIVGGKSSSNAFELNADSLKVNGRLVEFDAIESLRFDGQQNADTLVVNAVPTIATSFVANGAFDTVVGADGANTWNVTGANAGNLNTLKFSGVEHLTGGNATDTFSFINSGSIGGTLRGGGGVDTIDYTNFTNAVTVDLRLSTATGVDRFSNVDSFIGGSGPNTLIAKNEANTWNITGTNSGDVNGIDFTKFRNLIGGTQNDTFLFNDAGNVTGKMDGGAGTDVLDYSASTVDLDITLSNLLGIQEVVGSTNALITLIGPNVAFTWNITDADSGRAGEIEFSNIGRLVGGSRADTFKFFPNGSISEGIDGATGSDTADFSKVNAAVTVDISLFEGINKFIGGASGDDTLVGLNVANTWNITAQNAGTINTLAFSGFENLQGGTSTDSFVFADAKGVSGTIDGGGGRDTLNYAAFTTRVEVDLLAGTATKVQGGIVPLSIRDVIGGTVADKLTGDTQNNLLAGNAGDDELNGGEGNDTLGGGDGIDTITGGEGGDLLFGGLGADILDGSAGDDILFDGTTTFESSIASLDALLTAWNSGDAYATRVAELKAGTTGVAGAPRITLVASTGNPVTVTPDAAVDTLTGGGDLDWFLLKTTDPVDLVTDFDSVNELQN
jgi:Ca2+-binding RTX toxin-like protein